MTSSLHLESWDSGKEAIHKLILILHLNATFFPLGMLNAFN